MTAVQSNLDMHSHVESIVAHGKELASEFIGMTILITKVVYYIETSLYFTCTHSTQCAVQSDNKTNAFLRQSAARSLILFSPFCSHHKTKEEVNRRSETKVCIRVVIVALWSFWHKFLNIQMFFPSFTLPRM